MRVGLFVTCLVDLMRPEIGMASLELLESAGCEVVVPLTQSCCGQLAYNSGDFAAARQLAEKLLHEYEACDYVVLPSGSCAAMLRVHYPRLFATPHPLAGRMQQLADKTLELSEFLVQVIKLEQVAGNYAGKLTYHDSCSALRELGIKRQPRELLGKLPQARLCEMPDAEECCGFGGAFAAKYGELSSAIATHKCQNVQASGAPLLVGGDLGCLMNIQGRLRAMGDETTQVRHLAEVLVADDLHEWAKP